MAAKHEMANDIGMGSPSHCSSNQVMKAHLLHFLFINILNRNLQELSLSERRANSNSRLINHHLSLTKC